MIRIGSGAGFAGDRLEPAVVLAERAGLAYLGLECLAERTIALAQLRKLKDPNDGYDPLLARRMERLLPVAKRKGVRLLSNMGAANPVAGAAAVLAIAERRRIPLKVAAVTGDDVLGLLEPNDRILETGGRVADYPWLVSANAYLGAEALLPALESGADVILTGRVADPSLFLAPAMHAFGWDPSDWDRLAAGTVMGHLLECGGQVTGGYYADPGVKDVPRFAELGFPFVEIERDGRFVISKPEDSGGIVNLMTVKEQLLYEVTDPRAYQTPDVSADFTSVHIAQAGADRVAVSGATGRPRPQQLKVSIGYHAGWVGEGEISYAGPNARARAELAAETLRARLSAEFEALRVDLIGLSSLHGRPLHPVGEPYEIRVRVAGRAGIREKAERVGEEVEALWTNGPGGGGGARKLLREQIGVVSTLIERERVRPTLQVTEYRGEKATV
ncbi:MAG TPA: acyclic terpene utilization AtuA family protein [Burkholderiales bacterium]|nr:acyclic terpene utilization AtuA family protein [Burkholderiales bacterium]